MRILTNTSSGDLGLLLAREGMRNNFNTTLVLGPIGKIGLSPGIRVIRFKFFNELKEIIKKELSAASAGIGKVYDIIIFAAAVSDYLPQKIHLNKIKPTREKILSLKLKLAPKIVNLIKKFSPKSRLIAFKLESAVSDLTLISRARNLFVSCGADIIVANKINPYRAFILNEDRVLAKARSKKELSKKIFKILANL